METNLSKAYAEVDKILSFMETKYVEKVPKKMREIFRNEKDSNYQPNINKNIPLAEQRLERKTLAILAMLNIYCWCDNQEEKKDLLRAYSNNDKKRKELLSEKYNLDNFLKYKEKDVNQSNETVTEISEYKKENFIKKFLNRIKKIFKR